MLRCNENTRTRLSFADAVLLADAAFVVMSLSYAYAEKALLPRMDTMFAAPHPFALTPARRFVRPYFRKIFSCQSGRAGAENYCLIAGFPSQFHL